MGVPLLHPLQIFQRLPGLFSCLTSLNSELLSSFNQPVFSFPDLSSAPGCWSPPLPTHTAVLGEVCARPRGEASLSGSLRCWASPLQVVDQSFLLSLEHPLQTLCQAPVASPLLVGILPPFSSQNGTCTVFSQTDLPSRLTFTILASQLCTSYLTSSSLFPHVKNR